MGFPFLLLPTAALVFICFSRWFGKERGYLLGFIFYWAVWCLVVPRFYLGRQGFLSLFTDRLPLFSNQNWPVVTLLVIITLVTLKMYGRDFFRAPIALILVSVPAAAINGICEELLWRGLYVKIFPGNIYLAIVFPAAAFALWHLIPWRIFPEGNPFVFILSTFLLGLAYGWIAYKTGSAKWTAISHSLNGILALSGLLGPNILKTLRR